MSSQKKFLNLNIRELESVFELADSPLHGSNLVEVTPRVEHYLRKFDYNFVGRPTLERLHSSSSFSTNVSSNLFYIFFKFSVF